MTPTEEAVLLRCYVDAPAMVRKAIGFRDDDIAQEARLAMWRAVEGYDPSRGASLRTWVSRKGHYAILSAYQERTGMSSVDGHMRHDVLDTTSLDQLTTGAPDIGYDDPAIDAMLDAIDGAAELAELDIEATLEHFTAKSQGVIGRKMAGDRPIDIALGAHIHQSEVNRIMHSFRRHLTEDLPERAAQPEPVVQPRSVAEALGYFTTRQGEIISGRVAGRKVAELANRYGCSESEVTRLHGRFQDRLAERPVDPALADAAMASFSYRHRAIIRDRLAGMKGVAAAELHGYSEAMVSRIFAKFRRNLTLEQPAA